MTQTTERQRLFQAALREAEREIASMTAWRMVRRRPDVVAMPVTQSTPRWVYLVASAACAILALNWFMGIGPGFGPGMNVNEPTFLRFNLAIWPAIGLALLGARFFSKWTSYR